MSRPKRSRHNKPETVSIKHICVAYSSPSQRACGSSPIHVHGPHGSPAKKQRLNTGQEVKQLTETLIVRGVEVGRDSSPSRQRVQAFGSSLIHAHGSPAKKHRTGSKATDLDSHRGRGWEGFQSFTAVRPGFRELPFACARVSCKETEETQDRK